MSYKPSGTYVHGEVATGSATSLSTGTAKNVTTISLTPGTWEVEGNVNFNLGTASQTAASAGISTTTATLPTDGTEVANGLQTTTTTCINGITIPRKRIVVTTNPTTVYLIAKATFSGTEAAWGSITASLISPAV